MKREKKKRDCGGRMALYLILHYLPLSAGT